VVHLRGCRAKHSVYLLPPRLPGQFAGAVVAQVVAPNFFERSPSRGFDTLLCAAITRAQKLTVAPSNAGTPKRCGLMSSSTPAPGGSPDGSELSRDELGSGSGRGGGVGVDNDSAVSLLALLERFPELFHKEILERLDPADRAVLAQVGRLWLAAVAAAMLWDLPRAGKSAGVPLKLVEFLGSAQRLAWARDNGCPWDEGTCGLAAKGGHLVALRWARKNGCPWGVATCREAATGGHLEVLQWAREHDCPWVPGDMCLFAAAGGHLAGAYNRPLLSST